MSKNNYVRKSPCQECPFRIDLNTTMDESTINFVVNLTINHPCHVTREAKCKGARIFHGIDPQHPSIPVARSREELIEARA